MPLSVSRALYLILFVIGAGAIVYALGSGASGPRHSNRLEAFAIGELVGLDFSRKGTVLPEGIFFDVEGGETDLAAKTGKVMLVNYWATWCGPCEREMPHLATLQTARGGDAFQIVAISVDQSDDRDYAKLRLDELTGGVLDFYAAPPEHWDLVYNSGVRGFPTTILYAPDGTEIARLAGEADWSDGLALGFIDAVLAEQTAP